MNLSTLFTLSFAFLSIVSTVARASATVRDWKGDPVEAGVSYDLWGVGLDRGPIGIGKGVGGSECIRNVINYPNRWPEPFLPVPVSFKGANVSESLVLRGQDYNIIFNRDAERPCNVWQVNLEIGARDHNFITTGGQSGHPGCWNINTWFQLELVDDVEHLYKIIANPQVCLENSHCPEEITLVADGDEDRLYLNQRQYLQRPQINIRLVRHTSSILNASE